MADAQRVRVTDSASSAVDAAPPKPALRPALKSAPASPRPAATPPRAATPLQAPRSSILSTGLSAPHRAAAAAALRALREGGAVPAGAAPRALAIVCPECADAAAAALEAAGLAATTSLHLSPGAAACDAALTAACDAVAREGTTLVLLFCHSECAPASDALAAWVSEGGRRLARPPPRRALIRKPSLAARAWAFLADKPLPGESGGASSRFGGGASYGGGSSRGGPRHDADGAPVSLATAVDAIAVGLVEAEWRAVRAAGGLGARGPRPGGVAPALHEFAAPSLSREARVRAVAASLDAAEGDRTADLVADEAGRLSTEAVLKAAARRACYDPAFVPHDVARGAVAGDCDDDDDGCSPGAVAAGRLVVAALRLPGEGEEGPSRPALLRAGWCDVVGTRRVYYFEGGKH